MDLLLLLVLCYASMTGLVWWCWQHQSATHYPLRLEQLLLVPILILQAVKIWSPVWQQHALLMGFGPTLNLITWLMVLLYWAGSWRLSLQGLQLILFPCATVSLLFACLLPGQPAIYPLHNMAFMLHVISALLAYALFGITTLLAILMLIRNHYLHKRKMTAQQGFLPPLLVIEKLMFQGLQFGFLLLTIAVISGTVFAEAVFGEPAQFTHKTIFGVLSWLIYLGILFKHQTQAWRGKKVACWIIIAFISLMLAYIGSKFVLEILLHRTI